MSQMNDYLNNLNKYIIPYKQIKFAKDKSAFVEGYAWHSNNRACSSMYTRILTYQHRATLIQIMDLILILFLVLYDRAKKGILVWMLTLIELHVRGV